MRRLVLWDVDGTLVRGGVVAREALEHAVARVLHRPVASGDVQMSGKTDPQILTEIAAHAGVAADDRPAVVDAALGHLAEIFPRLADRFAAEGRVLPGVETLLARLHDRGDVLQTLLTGNIAANGHAKVAAFGLDRWLVTEAGAYGSDDPVRERLVPVALDRARRHAGHAWAPHDVWVVGDTPRDLACARAGGVRCLLVATGRYALDDLEGLGADAVRADLSDTEAVEALLADSPSSQTRCNDQPVGSPGSAVGGPGSRTSSQPPGTSSR